MSSSHVTPDGYSYCLGGHVILFCQTCGALVCYDAADLHTQFHDRSVVDQIVDDAGQWVQNPREQATSDQLQPTGDRTSGSGAWDAVGVNGAADPNRLRDEDREEEGSSGDDVQDQVKSTHGRHGTPHYL